MWPSKASRLPLNKAKAYFAHGFSARTSTALLGTMFGLELPAPVAWGRAGTDGTPDLPGFATMDR